MAQPKNRPLAAAVGAAFIASAAMVPLAAATENPFQAAELSSGYQVADHHAEGKCGEGRCGEDKKDKKDKDKYKDKDREKKADKDKEGKCGEGRCGEEQTGDDEPGSVVTDDA